MNSAYFMARAAQLLACTTSVQTGQSFDFTGREMSGCHECAGCDSLSRNQDLGVPHGATIIPGTVILSHDGQAKLRWPCPGCGAYVYEDTVPISSTEHAKAIALDPLCCTCRTRAAQPVAKETT